MSGTSASSEFDRHGGGAAWDQPSSCTRSTGSARGIPKVDLGVDAENTTGAVGLYERAGMNVARRTDAYEKELA